MSMRHKGALSSFLIAAIGFLPAAFAKGVLQAAPAAFGRKSSDEQQASRAPSPELADFSWLTGVWQGSWGPRTAQQAWTAPASGVMTGTLQVTESGKMLVTELFVLSQGTQSIELRIRHFTAALSPWQGTAEPAVLTLTGEDKLGLAFNNSSGGQPSRIVFRRIDPDHYILRSEATPGDGEGGNGQQVEISFHRLHETPPLKRKAGS